MKIVEIIIAGIAVAVVLSVIIGAIVRKKRGKVGCCGDCACCNKCKSAKERTYNISKEQEK